jgi:hypothetical protein
MIDEVSDEKGMILCLSQAILRMLGDDGKQDNAAAYAIVQEFLGQFTGGESGVIYKHDFIKTVLENRELLAVLSPFYGIV